MLGSSLNADGQEHATAAAPPLGKPLQADPLPTPPLSVANHLATAHQRERRRIPEEYEDEKRPIRTQVRAVSKVSTADNNVPHLPH